MSVPTQTPDARLAEAVDVARAAAVEAAAPELVGEHLAVVVDADRLVSHHFACARPGYVGWYWSISVSRAPDAESVTINDVVLLPGDRAVTAPEWTPYKDRIRPGDLSPGDVLPPEDDDLRLVPAWSAGDGEEQVADRFFAREVGLGREHVLSLEGREMAADRWHDGAQGPDTAMAKESKGTCGGCGFLVSLAGPLAERFGVCANGMANADGQVVSLEHGCGAHSEARLKRSASAPTLPSHVHDTLTRDAVDLTPSEPVVEPEAASVPEAEPEPDAVPDHEEPDHEGPDHEE